MKKCLKCAETKALTEFHKDKSRKDGLFSYCKICVNMYAKARQTTNISTEINVISKVCLTCKVEKLANMFGIERRNTDGLCRYCRDCSKERLKKRVRERKETYKNACRVNSLIQTKRLDKPSTHICAFGGCNTFAQEYHHILYDDIDNGNNLSIITPVCYYHHDVVEIEKNNGIDLSDKFSLRIQIERFGAPYPSTISYLN